MKAEDKAEVSAAPAAEAPAVEAATTEAPAAEESKPVSFLLSILSRARISIT